MKNIQGIHIKTSLQMTYKFSRQLQVSHSVEHSYKLHEYIDKEEFSKWEWAE